MKTKGGGNKYERGLLWFPAFTERKILSERGPFEGEGGGHRGAIMREKG